MWEHAADTNVESWQWLGCVRKADRCLKEGLNQVNEKSPQGLATGARNERFWRKLVGRLNRITSTDLLTGVGTIGGHPRYQCFGWVHLFQILSHMHWPSQLIEAETVMQALLTKTWICAGLFQTNPPVERCQKQGDNGEAGEVITEAMETWSPFHM